VSLINQFYNFVNNKNIHFFFEGAIKINIVNHFLNMEFINHKMQVINQLFYMVSKEMAKVHICM